MDVKVDFCRYSFHAVLWALFLIIFFSYSHGKWTKSKKKKKEKKKASKEKQIKTSTVSLARPWRVYQISGKFLSRHRHSSGLELVLLAAEKWVLSCFHISEVPIYGHTFPFTLFWYLFVSVVFDLLRLFSFHISRKCLRLVFSRLIRRQSLWKCYFVCIRASTSCFCRFLYFYEEHPKNGHPPYL